MNSPEAPSTANRRARTGPRVARAGRDLTGGRRRLCVVLVIVGLLGMLPACAGHHSRHAAHQEAIERDAIRDLLHRYAQFIDDARAAEFEELFSEEAVFSVIGTEVIGRDAIVEAFVGAPDFPRKHLPFPAVIEFVSDNEARSWADFIMVRGTDPEDPNAWAVYQMGRYHDRLVKEDDGRWRFAERRVLVLGMENPGPFPVLEGR